MSAASRGAAMAVRSVAGSVRSASPVDSVETIVNQHCKRANPQFSDVYRTWSTPTNAQHTVPLQRMKALLDRGFRLSVGSSFSGDAHSRNFAARPRFSRWNDR